MALHLLRKLYRHLLPRPPSHPDLCLCDDSQNPHNTSYLHSLNEDDLHVQSERIEVPETGHPHARHGGPVLFYLPDAFQSTDPLDYNRSSRFHLQARPGELLQHPLLLQDHVSS